MTEGEEETLLDDEDETAEALLEVLEVLLLSSEVSTEDTIPEEELLRLEESFVEELPQPTRRAAVSIDSASK